MADLVPDAEKQYQLAHIDQTLSNSIIAVNIAVLVIATTAVILRLVSRTVKGTAWKADDSVLVAALFATYILCIELILCAHLGMGHHILYLLQNPGTSDFTNVLKMQFASEVTWILCTYLVKLSNILLFARLFTHLSTPRFRSSLHLTHTFLSMWTIANFFNVLLQCSPVKSFWDLDIPGGCSSDKGGTIVTAAFNTFINVLLLLLPIRPVWQLQLPIRQKMAIIGIFFVGTFGLAASVTRMTYIIAIPQSSSWDPTYANAKPVLWAPVEPCVGIVCACLPLLRPLFANLYSKKLSDRLSSSICGILGPREADTWWHPPPEESSNDNYALNDVTGGSNVARSDWNHLSSLEHKIEVREEIVSVTEVAGVR